MFYNFLGFNVSKRSYNIALLPCSDASHPKEEKAQRLTYPVA